MLIILVYFRFNLVPGIAICVTVQTVNSTAYLAMSLCKYSREWTFLPHCLIQKVLCQTTYPATASIAEANKEVLKGVAEAKEPKRKVHT